MWAAVYLLAYLHFILHYWQYLILQSVDCRTNDDDDDDDDDDDLEGSGGVFVSFTDAVNG